MAGASIAENDTHVNCEYAPVKLNETANRLLSFDGPIRAVVLVEQRRMHIENMAATSRTTMRHAHSLFLFSLLNCKYLIDILMNVDGGGMQNACARFHNNNNQAISCMPPPT